jgi:hypothetical protein
VCVFYLYLFICIPTLTLFPPPSLLFSSLLFSSLLFSSLLFSSLLSRIVRIRGIVMDSRGLPFGHPVAPNRIIANCLLAGNALHCTALHYHARFFLFFSPYIYQSFSSSHTLLTSHTHSSHTHSSPLTHFSHHSHTLLTTHTPF